ncbi:unnamed protein product [Prorocentrum cordatum]|uniref:Uncharacterized protein n=1 Tax=Prorocentrum cordatum TaxID=2364126 RepID=A0ABN9WK49_9DINO|nr:unnamed protein product [Polarella glacialis]
MFRYIGDCVGALTIADMWRDRRSSLLMMRLSCVVDRGHRPSQGSSHFSFSMKSPPMPGLGNPGDPPEVLHPGALRGEATARGSQWGLIGFLLLSSPTSGCRSSAS